MRECGKPWHGSILQEDKQIRIVYVSRNLAMPNYHGGCVYADAILHYLNENNCTISYCWLINWDYAFRPLFRCPWIPVYAEKFLAFESYIIGRFVIRKNLQSILTIPLYLFKRILGCNSKRPLNRNDSIGNITSSEKYYFEKIIEREKPNVVIVDSPQIAEVLSFSTDRVSKSIIKIILTTDVVHKRVEAYRENDTPLDFMPLSCSEEIKFLGLADVIIAIQENDAREFKKMVPKSHVIVTPMPVEIEQKNNNRQVEGRCLFIGGGAQHNVKGICWFLNRVWPQVLEILPHASLVICGSVCEHLDNDHPNMHLLGNVSDLHEVYEEAMICIVPLQFGTGFKIKLAEAMARSRAVLSTSIGVEGFKDLENGQVVEVADDPAAFARSTVRLLRDKSDRERCITRQNQWIREHLLPEKAFGELLQLMQSN